MNHSPTSLPPTHSPFSQGSISSAPELPTCALLRHSDRPVAQILPVPRHPRSLPSILLAVSVFAAILAAIPLGAQDITNTAVPLDESALFGGSGDLVRVIDPKEAAAGTITLVEQKAFQPNLQFTGTVTALGTGVWNLDPPSSGTVPKDTFYPSVKSALALDFLASKTTKLHLDNTTVTGPAGFRSSIFGYYVDVRPTELTRLYVSGKTTYDITADTEWTFPLLEFFADTAIDRSVFFRFGKQYVSWGTGYWYSPADILSLAQIDPEDPTAKREGPFAFKVDYPFKQNLATLYFIGDKNLDPSGTAVAAKADLVAGSFELTAGAYYRPDMKVRPRLIGMVSGALWAFDIFGEAVLAWGSDRTYVRDADPTPVLYKVEDRPVFQGTGGFSWSYDDKDQRFSLDARAQLYYNGTGYDDTSFLKSAEVLALVKSGKLSKLDITQSGTWYAAGTVTLSKLFDDIASLGVTAIAGISDNSVKVTPALTIKPNLFSSIAVSVPLTFTAWAAPDRVDLKVDLSYRAFTF